MNIDLKHIDLVRMIRGIQPHSWGDLEKFSQYSFYEYDNYFSERCHFVPENSDIWLKYTEEKLLEIYKELTK